MNSVITTRPISDADRDFLLRVYASTREEELAIVPWTREQKDQFLRMQFTAQQTHYQEHYADAAFDILMLGEQPIGRLYVDGGPREIRIIDIALLPEYRRQGFGGMLIRSLLDEAASAGKVVSIHVEHHNPAMSLYTRLGFRRISDTGVYFLMEWAVEQDPRTT